MHQPSETVEAGCVLFCPVRRQIVRTGGHLVDRVGRFAILKAGDDVRIGQPRHGRARVQSGATDVRQANHIGRRQQFRWDFRLEFKHIEGGTGGFAELEAVDQVGDETKHRVCTFDQFT